MLFSLCNLLRQYKICLKLHSQGARSKRETPSSKLRREREMKFVNDGIAVDNSRTKYRDVIPVYVPAKDKDKNKDKNSRDVSNASFTHKPVSAGLGE